MAPQTPEAPKEVHLGISITSIWIDLSALNLSPFHSSYYSYNLPITRLKGAR